MTHTKRWQIAPILTQQANESLATFPAILRQVLFNRGYATDADARAFLNAETDFDTDPFQMTGMEAAGQAYPLCHRPGGANGRLWRL